MDNKVDSLQSEPTTRKAVPAETAWARSKHAHIIMYNTEEEVSMHKSIKLSYNINGILIQQAKSKLW